MKQIIPSFLATTGLFVSYGLTRYLDGLIRIFLRQRTGEGLLSALSRNADGFEAAGVVANHVASGVLLGSALVLLIAWFFGRPHREQAPKVARAFVPLFLSVGLTALAVVSLHLSPRFPYGINLALTLAYEGSFASVLAWGLVAVALVRAVADAAGPLPRVCISKSSARKWRSGGGLAVVVTACALFAWATPSRFWREGEGQGNMFKYARMAEALAGSGTLDIARAEDARETATVAGFVSRLPAVARGCLEESAELLRNMLSHALEGRLYLGTLQATRANRSMFRSPQGGIYYINAPGPGVMLVPAYLLDRSLNLWLGWEGQYAVVAFWNLLGALLVLEIARVSEKVGKSMAAGVLTAFALAVSPPLLLYTFQIYPELPAALGLLYSFRKLLMDDSPTKRGVLAAAVALAFLPWLHQKYSVAAAAVGLMAAGRFLQAKKARVENAKKLGLLLAPLVVSAFAVLVYNHALTGSLAPDATFQAVDRTSFAPRGMLRGLLGLLLDGENGLFVYSPIYLVTLVGARRLAGDQGRWLGSILVVVLGYVMVIASFPYWPGAVSSVSRYILSVAPFAAIAIAPVVQRSFFDGVLAGLAFTFFAGSVSMTIGFQRDIVHSYQPALLLGRTLYSDPHQYLPDFLSEGMFGSGPAHFTKLGVIAVGLALLVAWGGPRLTREPVDIGKDARLYPWRAWRAAMGVIGFLVLGGAFLERIPSNATKKQGPEYRVVRPLRDGSDIELAIEGRHGFEGAGVWVPGSSSTRFLVSSPAPLPGLRLEVTNIPRQNQILLSQRGSSARSIELLPGERQVFSVAPVNPHVFRGPDGDRFVYSLTVRSRASFVPASHAASSDDRRLGCYVILR